MALKFAGKTDIGKKRDNNQDCFSVEKLENGYVLCTVCDGMGGANGGSIASTLTRDTFSGYVSKNIASCEGTATLEVMTEALGKANKAVLDKAKEDASLKGMGTTIVTCLCDGEKYYCLTVGDSRIYSITEKEVKQLSHDHSYVQGLVDSGAITEKEARLHPSRNIITRAVGTDNEIDGDIFTVDCNRVKGLLLCSDGLCGYIEHEDLQKICLEEKSPEKCAEKLIQKANLESGADNITAVVVKNS